MTENNHLKDILATLTDAETVNLFASIHGLSGHQEVENRLKELWENHIDSLWREVLETVEVDPPLKRQKLQEQPSTSNVQHGGGRSMTHKIQEQPSTSTVQQEGEKTISESKKPYYIWKKESRTFKKNTATETTFKLKFNEQWTGEKLINIYEKVHGMFDDVLAEAKGDDSDLGRVVIQHPKLNNAIVVSLRKWGDLNTNTVMSEVTKVLNSNEDVPVDGDLIVTIGSIDIPKGGGGNKLPITTLVGPRNSLIKKHSIFEVQNDNNLCMAIAIGLCFLKTCKKVDSNTWGTLIKNESGTTFELALKYQTVPLTYYDNILKKTRKKMQTKMALKLCNMARVPTHRYLGLNDIDPIEALLGVNIHVISSRVGNKFVRVRESTHKSNLYLYHVEVDDEKHWHGIANIQGFFQGSYFCPACLKSYDHKHKHKCSTYCDVCLSHDCL